MFLDSQVPDLLLVIRDMNATHQTWLAFADSFVHTKCATTLWHNLHRQAHVDQPPFICSTSFASALNFYVFHSLHRMPLNTVKKRPPSCRSRWKSCGRAASRNEAKRWVWQEELKHILGRCMRRLGPGNTKILFDASVASCASCICRAGLIFLARGRKSHDSNRSETICIKVHAHRITLLDPRALQGVLHCLLHFASS